LATLVLLEGNQNLAAAITFTLKTG
jgi:hypothetical protein